MSVDPIETSLRLKRRLGLSFPLLSDVDLAVIRAYGLEMAGQAISLPATYVLAAGTGQILMRHVGETVVDRPRLAALLAALRQDPR